MRPTLKYFACGCAKYRPLTDAAGIIAHVSVSGLYFAHPQAKYFTVGRVGRDQVEDYAKRKGMDVADAERWLAPNLSYEPSLAPA